jgi:hypothetical protein
MQRLRDAGFADVLGCGQDDVNALAQAMQYRADDQWVLDNCAPLLPLESRRPP